MYSIPFLTDEYRAQVRASLSSILTRAEMAGSSSGNDAERDVHASRLVKVEAAARDSERDVSELTTRVDKLEKAATAALASTSK